MRRRIGIWIGAIVLLSASLGGVYWYVAARQKTAFVNNAALAELPEKDASGIDTTHLARDLMPPTNKWFSGIALQKEPKTIFPTPLGFSATDSSFSYGLPIVTTSAASVSGSLGQIVTTEIEGATHYQVTRYDELSVDLTFSGSAGALARVTVTEGSPYIQVTALRKLNLTMSMPGEAATVQSTAMSFQAPNATYRSVGFGAVGFQADGKKVHAQMERDSLVTMYALPTGASKDYLRDTADARITGATVTYSEQGDSFQTMIHIATEKNNPTAYTFMPHQTTTAKSVLTYSTIYGEQTVSTGTDFSFRTSTVPVSDALDLSHITGADKALLTTTLRREINATTYVGTDTYFAGKELYRSAQLLQLAMTLGEANSASTIQNKLRQQLETWLSIGGERSTKYFYYDTRIHSVVGVGTSFGSEAINDHHFHYGYFIYAAGVLATYDKTFLETYRSQVDVLVADIANYKTNEALPLRRSFDPYMSHSWASGSAPFNDGNNQESSSEAINAWLGVALWAKQSGNTQLATQAGWMLSGEAASAKAYWREIQTSQSPFDGVYTHTIVSLNWSGKRDYTTFFSAEPNAIFGIQLIPLSPSMVKQLAVSPAALSVHLAEALPAGSYAVSFGDYLLMYSALGGVHDQLAIAKSLPDAVIDGANSRSYMYAWIMSQAK